MVGLASTKSLKLLNLLLAKFMHFKVVYLKWRKDLSEKSTEPKKIKVLALLENPVFDIE